MNENHSVLGSPFLLHSVLSLSLFAVPIGCGAKGRSAAAQAPSPSPVASASFGTESDPEPVPVSSAVVSASPPAPATTSRPQAEVAPPASPPRTPAERTRAPLTPPSATVPAAPSSGPWAATNGALSLGDHACYFSDATGSYNRICRVSQRGRHIAVSSRGSKLNPDRGFEFEAHGGPRRYAITGSLRAFDGCSGAVGPALDRFTRYGNTWYAAQWGNKCQMWIRAATIREMMISAQTAAPAKNAAVETQPPPSPSIAPISSELGTQGKTTPAVAAPNSTTVLPAQPPPVPSSG